jgi:phosphoribosylaminoimidazole-succinocarboxamide synthase
MSDTPLSLELLHLGKVRDSYRLTERIMSDRSRLVRVSDRISIFDFVLGFDIPQKGEVLAVMNAFWRQHLIGRKFEDIPFMFEADVVACGPAIDRYLPSADRGNHDLWKRATVVREVSMIPYEAIVRGYLTGTGFEAYKREGVVCGHYLPAGLAEGAKLQTPIFTPTTKAPIGHDEHLTHQFVNAREPLIGICAMGLYRAMAVYAETRGLILVDTKMEFGIRTTFALGKILVLADEVGTPDSSRIWKKADYDASFPQSLPPSFDKQFVREWGKKEGVNDPSRFDPKNPEHRVAVKKIIPPRSVVDDTRDIYLSVPEMLTGMTLKQCQKEFLGC